MIPELAYSLAGLLVGLLVGLTGVGGGSLMAPLLILLFGLNPSVAVGTDLWFAALTKIVSGAVHRREGSPDWQVVRRLAMGSLPAALATLAWLHLAEGGKLDATALKILLGTALVVTALLTPMKGRLVGPLTTVRDRWGPRMRSHQLIATIAAGAAIGALVTLTSIGAGALVAVTLMLLYPLRLDTRTVVGTDIVHAVPLALVAAVGHSWLGNVDWAILGQLLLGSLPGAVLGSLLTGRIRENWIRWALSLMLVCTGLQLLLHR